MRSYTRHQLKQDSFRTSTTETISWAVEHRSKVTAAVVAVGVILAVLIGGWAFVNYRDQQASSELAGAIQKYDAPIRPAGTPATPEMLSFGSIQERAKVSNAEFTHIADKYSFTQSGRVARYFAGITLHEMGDNTAAEKDLKDVADSRYQEIASLAKLALASIYHDTNRDPQAIEIYKQLADHPTVSVGKSTAQFLLASLYEEDNQPDQARKLYQQMQKENPSSQAAQMASQRLQALK
ncbi:MAG: tetratricopeptide repeat protein [Candidatus Korobacteraceae bacterium]